MQSHTDEVLKLADAFITRILKCCTVMNRKNKSFQKTYRAAILFILSVTGIVQCNSSDPKHQLLVLNPPLGTPIQYSVSKITSEGDLKNRVAVDSSTFTIVFVEKDDSIFSGKLYLNYIASQFPNGRKITTDDSILKNSWGSDYISAISFLQKHVISDSFWIIIHMNGTVLRVDGFDSIVNRLQQRFNIDKRTIRSLLQEQTGNQAIKDMLSQLFFYLPGRVIKKNDNWVRNVTVTVKAPIKYSNFIKVRNIHDDTVVLDVQSAITARTGEGGTIYEEGKRTFEIHVVQQTGLPIMWSGVEQTIYTAQGSSVRKKVITRGKRI